MKALIALLLLMGAFWVCKNLYLSYQKVEQSQSGEERSASGPGETKAAAVLPGMPASLESSLAAAMKLGANGLRDWLAQYRIYVKDPRLASIELDYVVLLSHQDPAEAKRIFRQVQDRITLSSPVYERVKRLQKTFE